MPLPAPHLDDRTFQSLVDDAKRLVQQRCPEWTDHNVHDPGVTLIETFAYMVDQLLWRLNRVPDRTYVKFLDLLGVRLRPPTAARVPVTFWLSAPQQTTLDVPAGTQVATARTESEPVVFTTLDDLAIVPCSMSWSPPRSTASRPTRATPSATATASAASATRPGRRSRTTASTSACPTRCRRAR